MRNACVKVLAHAILSPAEEKPGFGANDLHFAVFALHIQSDAHFLGAAGGEGDDADISLWVKKN